MANRWRNNGNSDRQTLFSWPPNSLQMVTRAMKLKDICSLREKLRKTYTAYKKQRYHFADKGPYSQSYGFSSSYIQMWEFYRKEGWAPKNWRFQTVVLENPWTARRSNQSILKEINLEYSMEGLMLKLQYFGHLLRRTDSMETILMLGKIEGRRRSRQQRMRWLDGTINSMDISLCKPQSILKDREA